MACDPFDSEMTVSYKGSAFIRLRIALLEAGYSSIMKGRKLSNKNTTQIFMVKIFIEHRRRDTLLSRVG